MGTSVNVYAQSDTDVYEQIVRAWLKSMGISDEDIDYAKDKLFPLYNYIISNRNYPSQTNMSYSVDSLAKAPADGIYFGLCNYLNSYELPVHDYSTGGINDSYVYAMHDVYGGKIKRNGAYPWGVVQTNGYIYFGTVNNILCMPSWQSMTSLGSNKPYDNGCWVCEYEQGTRKDAGVNGDIERPRIYRYDINGGVLADITPDIDMLDDCLGLRSAAAHNGVVFMGGPGLDSDQGQTSTTSAFLAFDDDGNFLANSDMQNIDGCRVTDVRRWVVHNGVLYVGVAITTPEGVNKGAILRWYGDKNDPFKFHIVGYTANEAGEICVHNGRLYAGGWPTSNMPVSCIFEGPVIPEGGYTPESATEWPVMWSMAQYEPNAMNLQMEQCSLLRSYKGKLYWSMWYVQYGLPMSIQMLGLDMSSTKGIAALLANLRQATLWRADTEKKGENNKFSEVEMLYGEDELPQYNLATGEVELPKPNVSGYKHVYGRAGFDRQFTAYMWASEEYNDNLYIGTMSTEAVLEPAIQNAGDDKTKMLLGALTTLLGVQESHKGYELYRFKDGDSPAETVTQDGFGNHAQYGIRNMVLSEDGSDLYLGTASPFNIHEWGGWRMLRFHDNDFVPSGMKKPEIKPASILIKRENEYYVLSSLLGEKITRIQVYDLAGRQVYSEIPANDEAYIFNSQIGNGTFVVKVSTKTGVWTTKLTVTLHN